MNQDEERVSGPRTSGPLSGIRILEVGHILAAPFAAMLLADLGADVIKLETDEGDMSRQVASPVVGGHNSYFASINRGKRSVRLELATAEGQAQLAELARTAHALIVNLRPSAIRKYGLDYVSLRRHNPKIVAVALTGYGMDGDGADWPSFDYIVQAMSGVAMLTGEPDGPATLAGYSAVDNSSGIMAALALLAKVYEAERSGVGGQVDVSLFDTMLAQLNYKAASYLNGGGSSQRLPMGSHVFYVPAQLVESADGYFALFVTHDEMWRALCVEIGHEAWVTDPRFTTLQLRHDNREALLDLLIPVLRTATSAEWVARLRPLGLPVGPVQTLDEALDSDFVAQRDLLVSLDTEDGPIRVVGSPLRFDGRRPRTTLPPRLHEHTAEILGGS
ncbi:MAG TPA: CoA transferase [Jatrophihabitans sp.]|jgi:crotonobetainyl-CoA:carnitine CoA-transferase CaiB-like acyl-CoA transferase